MHRLPSIAFLLCLVAVGVVLAYAVYRIASHATGPLLQ